MQWMRWFTEVGIGDVALVGGKNASLGEMLTELHRAGVPVPDGFAVTVDAFRYFVRANGLEAPIATALTRAGSDVSALEECSRAARALMMSGRLPADLEAEIRDCYRELARRSASSDLQVAVRSSATTEDLPGASFAGAHETYLNVRGEDELLVSVKRCFASLYTPRAIRYRRDMGFSEEHVGLSVGIQRMLRSDAAVSGVIFTLDTETGFRDVVQIDAIYGLGENIVQGRVRPDEYYVHKPTLRAGYRPILRRTVGSKELRLVYDPATREHENVPVSAADRDRLALSDDEVLQLAQWALAVEDHYTRARGQPTPMDLEFAKDGPDGSLYLVQARPETVHSAKRSPTIKLYELTQRSSVLVQGLAVGEQVATGDVRVIQDPAQMESFRPGEVLVTESTNPDWEPILKQARAVVTARGGRTSHAAIVARELGIPAVVGAASALAR